MIEKPDPSNPRHELYLAASKAMQDHKTRTGHSPIADPYGTAKAAVDAVLAVQASQPTPPRKPPRAARARKGAGSR